MDRLPQVKAASPSVFSWKNRRGDTYYLHEGRTKTGKPRYFFAKAVSDGALGAMPDGFEVSESLNGVVSVRRTTAAASPVADEDVKIVEREVARHSHLARYAVRVLRAAIVVFEPDAHSFRAARGGRMAGDFASLLQEMTKNTSYSPVVKFEWGADGYTAFRMTYRGKGGWSWPLKHGKLADLTRSIVPAIGTDDFFELL
jgi:hypothetical protein